MVSEAFLKEGKFYFWRNLFGSVIVSIFVTIGSSVAFSWALFRSAESGMSKNERSIAVIQSEVGYFREEQKALKSDMKEDMSEIKQLIKEKK